MLRFITHCVLTKRERNKVVITEDDLHNHAGIMLSAFWPNCWTVRIHPKYKNDVGLYVHEVKGHVADYMAAPWTYSWRMLFDWKYRWKNETKYYAMQYLCYPPDESLIDKFAGFIATGYRLPVSVPEAKSALIKEIKFQQQLQQDEF